MIDLRSDTVTKPTPEMREFMFNAQVGDDVFQDDPTVNELQTYCAERFGFEDALFCSSGTQTNQIAINVHVQPGGEVICHEEAHIYKYEGGGISKNSGASVRLIRGNRGRLTVDDIQPWINPDDVHYPITQLVSIEDTANRGGGACYDFEEIKRIHHFCKSHGLPLHLDGARLMNRLVATKTPEKEYCGYFDSISICLSKGLGAPVGSILLGNKDFIKKARRVRKVFGGGMRQAGIIAAGGLYALKYHVDRLEDDHRHAKQIEKTLVECDWIDSVIPVETNIVVGVLKSESNVDAIINELKNQGILIMKFGPKHIRFVTHLDISSSQIDEVCSILKAVKLP